MPTGDVVKVALIILLVGSVVALGVWFMGELAPDVVDSGVSATAALDVSAAAPWAVVVSIFGPAWSIAWKLALVIVLVIPTGMFILRILKWAQ